MAYITIVNDFTNAEVCYIGYMLWLLQALYFGNTPHHHSLYLRESPLCGDLEFWKLPEIQRIVDAMNILVPYDSQV